MTGAPITAPLLSAAEISFAYGPNPALRGISLELFAGEVVAMLGPNGSGKSTLIKSLLRLLPASGKLAWSGRAAASWSRREFSRLVAYLPQAPTYDAEQTVADTLRLGRAPYSRAFGLESERDMEVVQDVARRLSLVELLDRPMDELSGGQRQRVFVGRCLVQEPRALLLDEPNTYLDLRHQVELCELLRKLAAEQGMAVLMASHDINLAAAFADRLIVLGDGEVATHGRAAEVMNPELLSRVYGVPLRLVSRSGEAPVILPVAAQA